jgi:hypothetical protein
MGELASIHNHPILQKWRGLNEGLSQVSQLAPYESAHGIAEFFEKSFDSPVGVIGPDNFDVINYRKASINTVGDFVMFCFANPKDWFGKVGHFKTLQEIREIVDKIEKLGVLLPLSDELRSDKLTTKLKDSGLKPETLEALKRVYYYQCECVGDVIIGLYYKPEKWFEYNYRSKPDIGYEEALELLNMITSLGFKIPPTDNIVVPDEKGKLPPTLEELNLREETKRALEKSGINSMAKFLIAYTNDPESWYKRLRLGEGAIEIMMKMAAMGYLEVFNE